MSTSFIQAIKLGFVNYFNFTGVARRSEYWWFYLFTVLALLVASSLDLAFGFTSTSDLNKAGPLYNVLGLALLIPNISVYVRRLRDSGRHWANIFWNLIPIAGLIIWIYQLTQPTKHIARDTYAN